MTITSNNGMVFRTESGITALTAHVYMGKRELSSEEVAKMGLLRWYRNGTPIGTGQKISAKAPDVGAGAVYRARLEA